MLTITTPQVLEIPIPAAKWHEGDPNISIKALEDHGKAKEDETPKDDVEFKDYEMVKDDNEVKEDDSDNETVRAT